MSKLVKIQPFSLGDYEEYIADKKFYRDKDNIEEIKKMLNLVSPSYKPNQYIFTEFHSPIDCNIINVECNKDDPRYRREVLLEWEGV